MRYVTHSPISLRAHPDFSEKWLQQRIIEDPALLGLGDVDVRDVERAQSQGGRLDMLLYDSDTDTRYEVELQLGATDESHIIRTIEYWDSERRRYPQYDHVAVIVAEEITARFFNVISLFNGFIPIMAIQVSAIEVAPDEVTLVFGRVLDRMTLGTEIEDEGESADRAYWEAKASVEMLALTDQLLALVKEIDPHVELKYNKYYIGLVNNGVATNYVSFKPRKRQVNVDIRLPRSDELAEELEELGFVSLPYVPRSSQYRPIVNPETLEQEAQADLLKRWFRMSYETYG